MSDVFQVEVDEDESGYFDDPVRCERCGVWILGVLDDPEEPSLCSDCTEVDRRARIVSAIEADRQEAEA